MFPLLLLSCSHPTTPPQAAEQAPAADVAGWEGFFPLAEVDGEWLTERGLPLTAAAIDAARGRVGKLVLHDGERQAKEEDLESLWTATCVDPEVAAWNTDRCQGLSERKCTDGECTYQHYGNCSGVLLQEGLFLTAAHCVVSLASDAEALAQSAVILPDLGGKPVHRVGLRTVRAGKLDFEHHWVVVEDSGAVDVGAIWLAGPDGRGEGLPPLQVGPLPPIGDPLFLAGFPRVERRSPEARAAAGYELVAGTPSVSFGRLADPNPAGLPLCNVDGYQEHWNLASPCPVEEISVEGEMTWRGPITQAPFLATYDASNGNSGGPVFDSQGRLVGLTATLIGQVDPQEQYSADTRMVATSIGPALEALGLNPHDAGPCNALSTQELWGRAVLDPAAEGFTLTYDSEHFRFWSAPGVKPVDGMNTTTSEAHRELLVDLLDADPTGPLEVFTYPDAIALGAATSSDRGLVILRNHRQLHLQSYRQLHEFAHVYSYLAAGRHRTIPLVEEGFAEAYGNWTWRPGDPLDALSIKEADGKHVHDFAAGWLSEGTLPPLAGLLEDKTFRGYNGPNAHSSYFFAASFVRYLVDEHGVEPLRTFLREVCVEDDAGVVEGAFERIYSSPLTGLEEGWHEMLRERQAP